MSGWNRVRDRLRGLFRREAVLREIDEEMAAHLELLEAEHRRRGLSPAEARAAARAAFGDPSAARDAGYDVRGGGALEATWHDLRFALRTLRRRPGVTVAALVTWALGIGATVAVFSVVYPVLVRALPFPEPDRLVMVVETNLPKFTSFAVAPGNFLAYREHNRSFERLAAMRRGGRTMTGSGEPERLRSLAVTDGYFETYGVTPLLGRTFAPEEDAPGRDAVAILEHGLWQRRFGGDPGIVGREIVLDDRSVTVVGVMPPLHPGVFERVDVWVPAAFTPQQRANHGGHTLHVVGRLRAGVTMPAAIADLDGIAARLERERPDSNNGWRATMKPLTEWVSGPVRPTLLMLAVAVAFVLLIAAANVANLLLGRAAARERELAVRAALGAGRGRLLRQLACESLLLALAGGALGLLLAAAGVDLLLAAAPRAVAGVVEIELDAALLAFTFGLSAAVGLAVAFATARKTSAPDLAHALRGNAGGLARGHTRTRRTLIVVEVAACLLLLIGAGLVVRSLGRALAVDPGIRAADVLKVDLGLTARGYPDDAARTAFVARAVAELAALPGVEGVAATQTLPFEMDYVQSFWIAGRPEEPPGKEPSANYYAVTPDYFRVLGVPLLRGRAFSAADGPEGRVAIINDKLARTFFPDGDAVGKRIRFSPKGWLEIVGVAGDVKHYGVTRETTYQVYEPLAQQPFASLSFVLRATRDAAALGPAIRARVAALDPAMPIVGLRAMRELVDGSTAAQRFAVGLFGAFALVALLLAVVGIYGVIADAVIVRTHEIGLRVVLGARPRDVLGSMMRVGVLPALGGIAIGLAGAFAAARLMRGVLFEVTALDPATWIAASLVVAAVAVAASYLPARRAMRVDPMIALRDE